MNEFEQIEKDLVEELRKEGVDVPAGGLILVQLLVGIARDIRRIADACEKPQVQGTSAVNNHPIRQAQS